MADWTFPLFWGNLLEDRPAAPPPRAKAPARGPAPQVAPAQPVQEINAPLLMPQMGSLRGLASALGAFESGGKLPGKQGAPKAKTPQLTSSRPASNMGPAADAMLPALAAAKALGLKKVSMGQLQALSGMLAAPAKPTSGKDAAYEAALSGIDRAYQMDVMRADQIENADEAAAAIRAAEEAQLTRRMQLLGALEDITAQLGLDQDKE